jgi:group I intron endonuclease
LKNYTVYIHINKINNKKYVGITCRKVNTRWGKDGKGYNGQELFWRAIQKYGWDNFQHLIVFENVNKELALELEKQLILENKTFDSEYGYNSTFGGEIGVIPTERVRLKISDLAKGRKHSEETKRKISEALTGKKHSQESREKMLKYKKENINPWRGQHHTEEARNKMRKNRKRIPHTEEHKQKLKENHADFSGEKHPQAIKCILINTKEIFSTITEASEAYNTDNSSIAKCCKGKRKSAGKHPETREPLRWMFYEDYLNQQENKEYINSDLKIID